jgi:site-specific DNA-methyltransferase (adenine-specific)
MTITHSAPRNRLFNADCIDLMRTFNRDSVDMILTDPPYIVGYRARDGRTVANDDNAGWLRPAFSQMHRILKPGGVCVSFYGWNKVDLFMAACRAAGYRVIGHMVFRKQYASSARFLRYQHESAYVLAKGEPPLPADPIPDVLDFPYTGNRLHPTQKPVEALLPLIASFTQPGDLVLDPFCGSGSTLEAARRLGRDGTGIERNGHYFRAASDRLYRTVGRLTA